jgi:hypothetical protein
MVDVSIKNMSNKKTISVIDDILNSALTLFLPLKFIIMGRLISLKVNCIGFHVVNNFVCYYQMIVSNVGYNSNDQTNNCCRRCKYLLTVQTSICPPAVAILWKAWIIPTTVPKKPVIGPAPEMVATYHSFQVYKFPICQRFQLPYWYPQVTNSWYPFLN